MGDTGAGTGAVIIVEPVDRAFQGTRDLQHPANGGVYGHGGRGGRERGGPIPTDDGQVRWKVLARARGAVEAVFICLVDWVVPIERGGGEG